jgi:hypothetical protein
MKTMRARDSVGTVNAFGVTTGASRIGTIDVNTGALRIKVCCSSIYGEAVFTPDGQTIIKAGPWPGMLVPGSLSDD